MGTLGSLTTIGERGAPPAIALFMVGLLFFILPGVMLAIVGPKPKRSKWQQDFESARSAAANAPM